MVKIDLQLRYNKEKTMLVSYCGGQYEENTH